MTYTRLALVFGALAVVGLCVLASIGFTPAIAILVTLAVLVLFVGAGNLVSGRPGKPRFARPPEAAPEREPAAVADLPPVDEGP